MTAKNLLNVPTLCWCKPVLTFKTPSTKRKLKIKAGDRKLAHVAFRPKTFSQVLSRKESQLFEQPLDPSYLALTQK